MIRLKASIDAIKAPSIDACIYITFSRSRVVQNQLGLLKIAFSLNIDINAMIKTV